MCFYMVESIEEKKCTHGGSRQELVMERLDEPKQKLKSMIHCPDIFHQNREY